MTQAPVRPARTSGPGGTRTPADAWPWRPALALAVRAAVLGVLTVEVVVLLLWATEQGSTAGPGGALRTGIGFWLAAHHTGFDIRGGHLGVTPYGLTLLPSVLLWRGGARMARHFNVLGPRQIRRAALCTAGAYAVLNVVLALLTARPGMRPIPLQALLGSAAVAFLATAAGAVRAGTWRPVVSARTAAVLRAAGAAVLGVIAAGALTALLLIVVRHADVTGTGHAVAPSASGTVGLVLLDLLAAPTVVICAASVLLGPGFGIGTGTSVSLGGVSLGPVPGLPVLGAVPASGTLPAVALLVLAIPVGLGVVAGFRMRDGETAIRELLLRAVSVAGTAGAAFAVLAWLADGPAGPGRMAVAGPSPWQIGLAAAAEIGGGALIVALITALRARRTITLPA